MAEPAWSHRRRHVLATVRGVLAGCEPSRLVHQHWPAALDCADRVWIAAGGKASIAMALACAQRLGPRLAGGVVLAPVGVPARGLPRRLKLRRCDHPLPTRRNVSAAAGLARFVGTVPAGDTLLVLLSGGASAHLSLPAPDVTLAELRALTRALLRSGASIDEVNAVRRHVERLKGGGLARLAARQGATVVTLLLSDVIGNRLETIGSGPTAPDPTTFADALDVVGRYRLATVAPGIVRRLRRGARGRVAETAKPGDAVFDRVQHVVVGSNRDAVQAARGVVERLGFAVRGVVQDVTGGAQAAGTGLARRIATAAPGSAIVMGGETTVAVGPAQGLGGPCQELVLAAAVALDGRAGVVVAAIATDGIDGPTPAAGAAATGDSCRRARALGLDPQAALHRHDSATLWRRLGSRIRTGPTGTNLNDVALALRYRL